MKLLSSPRVIHHLRCSLLVLLPAVGLLMVFHPTLLSGFARMQMFPDDTVFNHLVMEHGWCWVSGRCWDAGFWNPPFGHPLPNIRATSDLLMSFGPLYWIWRAVGINPWTSFSLWMFSISLANFVVCQLMLRRCFGATLTGAAFGAFIFAFASPRTGQLNHQQLLPHFFLLMIIWGLLRVFDESLSARRRAIWLYVAAGSLAAQLWGALYNFEFICIVLLVTLLWALGLRRYRRLLLSTVRRLWLHGLLAAALCAAIIAPALAHYLQAARDSMVWHPDMGLHRLPQLPSWIHVGDHSWIYGWMSSLPPFAGLPARFEHVLSIGMCSTVAALVGLWIWRKRPGVRLMALVSVSVMALFTLYPGGLTLWPVLFSVIPGLETIRIPVRIGMLLLIPAAVGLGAWASKARSGWRRKLMVPAVVLICCLEQGGSTASFEVHKRWKNLQQTTSQLAPGTAAFMVLPPNGTPLSPATELRAMEAALYSGVPTFNLHTSAFPNRWPLRRYYFHGKQHFENRDIYRSVLAWARRHSIDAARVRIVELRHTAPPRGVWAPAFKPTPVPSHSSP